jgi:glycosyltransferase involved in cell wall biosynthesis
VKGTLLLVSARADAALRDEIAAGRRPRTEFLELERSHHVELLDWSRLGRASRRSGMLSLRHALAALPRLSKYQVVFSDGEHIGIPLALAMGILGPVRPHVVIGHWLTAPKKRAFFRTLHADRHMTRIIAHSRTQILNAVKDLGISPHRFDFVPYNADPEFWRPVGHPEQRLIVSAGIEHRDYALLDRTCDGIDAELFIAAGSLYSPAAVCTLPRSTTRAVVRPLDHLRLRDLYDKAAIVVVPLLANDFQAGVTTLLEAMAMGKAVVVSGTEGQRDIVDHGETGMLVTPGDERALRDTLVDLLRDPAERARLGYNARRAVQERFSLDRYVEALARNISAAAAS